MRTQDCISATKAADKGFQPFSLLGGRGLAFAKKWESRTIPYEMKVSEVLSILKVNGWYLVATVSSGRPSALASSSRPAPSGPTRPSPTSGSWTTT